MSVNFSSLQEAIEEAFSHLNCDELLSDGHEYWSKLDLLAAHISCPPGNYTVLDDGTILQGDSPEPRFFPAHYANSGSHLKELMSRVGISHDDLIRNISISIHIPESAVRILIDDLLCARRDIRNVPFRFGLSLAARLGVSPFDLL